MGCKAFEKLLNEVEKAKIPGIGELAIYDTAHRISVALGIPLDGIYMHAGTKRGAKKLFGSSQIKGKKRLEKTDFPSSFNGFTEEEIENMLCISFGH